MRKFLATAAGIIGAALAYLLFWPVPIDPVAWEAPEDVGLVDPFAPDDRLARAHLIDLGSHEGPEDLALGPDGHLYVTTESGVVLQVDPAGGVREFAAVDGRALGIETAPDGSLLTANPYVGIQRITAEGTVEKLVGAVNDQPLVYANDLAIAADGTIFFSESSTKFGARQYGGTYAGSLLDLMEHGGHGRIIAFNPASGEARVILDGLNFANGVAISDDQRYLVIAETGAYRILKHWLQGPSAGSTEVLLDNLPGFPDNINNGMRGRFWIGLVAPRSEALDALSGKPFLRRVVQRLPAALRPRAMPSAHVIAINGEGQVLMNLQDTNARLPSLTGVIETRETLYLTSLFGNQLGALRKEDLQ